ncbi:MAG: hypothetical protein BHW56_07205 [Acetobacter sp. 46_36]|nr:MAG: hypothetical protein BHW56_07205 [Acetobacter sp. 46_36]
MRAILSKVLIFGSLRGAFFMDVRESDRKTARASRTGKAEKPEEGCARADGESGETGGRLCARGREKQINRKEAGRRTNGESGQRRPGGRRTAAEVDNLPAALKVFAQGYIMMRNWATILTI